MSHSSLFARLDRAVAELPMRFPGSGGAVAVLRQGEVLVRHAWGYANAEQRIAFTPRTLFRMCSITKQFTCAALLDAASDPSVFDAAVAARLNIAEGPKPTAAHLAHNQSGLRDYWAVAMLYGSPAEAPFGEREAQAVIANQSTLQFAPGTRYSYCNQNFRILSDVLQDHDGQDFARILRRRVFDRAGMETAFLAADTRAMPDGTEGYEGSQTLGFRPSVNRILWTGDAGLGASLDDMIAWERFIDATRDDETSLYRRLAAPVRFGDGAPASYGFGLARSSLCGRALTGHGGALRGWRSHRLYAAAERISVVVMLNHLSPAHLAAGDLFAAALGEPPSPAISPRAAPDWLGAWHEPETGLSARFDMAGAGHVTARFAHQPEVLELAADGSARSDSMRITPTSGGLVMERPVDNLRASLQRLPSGPTTFDAEGRYRCAELGAELVIANAGGVLYGGFSGRLGDSRMERLDPIAKDVMALPCHRALDHTPPGDWTLHFQRSRPGAPDRIEVGCWLARGLTYERVSDR